MKPHVFGAWLGVGLALLACGRVSDDTGTATPDESGAGAANGGDGATNSADAGATTRLGITDTFDSPNPFNGSGLWMELGESLPIDEPPRPHDGSALHLVGDSGAGLDFFFHTAFPVEEYFSRVDFWAQSELPGATLKIAVAGPEPKYFADRDGGFPWPVQVVSLASDWQPFEVAFASLGIDETHPGPREKPFGAVHFIVEPDTHYDFWIDDFALPPAR